MRFAVLGLVSAEHDGAAARLMRSRARGLLGLLLLYANRPVPIDLIVDSLWADAPPRTARRQVYAMVHHLRTELRRIGCAEVLRFTGSGYTLPVEREHLDLAQFRHLVARAKAAGDDPDRAAALLRAALDEWRGPALADASGAFVGAARARLEEERLSALECLMEAELNAGRHADVVTELENLVATFPFRERLRGLLMVALYRSGRQVDALATLRELRTALADGQGLNPGKELQELEQAILRADAVALAPVAVGERPAGGSTPHPPATAHYGRDARNGTVNTGPAVAPAELPPDVSAFVGREAEIAVLERAVAQRPLSAVAIVGPAGVGKTGLALRWAHAARGRYPDGQLYLDLHGFDPHQPLTVDAALQRLLQSLGVTGPQLPSGTDALAAMYRSLVARRRLLVVLDNAADSVQVRPLLPGTESVTTLVTSRRRLDGLAVQGGVHLLSLAPLPPDVARALLARLAGVDPAAPGLDALIRLCGGLPLALRIAAARLVGGADLDPVVLAAELSDERARLHGLAVEDGTVAMQAALRVSYQRLTPPAARLFSLIGLHPGPRPALPACAAMADLPQPVTRATLDELVTAHLAASDGGRYVLHDLVRLYAAEVAHDSMRDAERDAALVRVLDWYAEAARTADPQWLDEEQANLHAAVRLAVERGWHDTVWRLVHAHWQYLGMRADRSHWLALSRLAYDAVLRTGDRVAQGVLLNGMAIAHVHIGEFNAAITCFTQAVEVRRGTGDRIGLSTSLTNLAGLYGDMGRVDEAVDLLRESIVVLEDVGDEVRLAVALNNLAVNLIRQRRPDDAVATASRARALAVKIGDLRTESFAESHLGDAYSAMQRTDDAHRRYQRALRLARRTGDRYAEASVLLAIGDLLAGAGRRADAEQHWQEALAHFTALADVTADEARSRLAG